MKVVAISGSPRKQGSTDLLLRTELEPPFEAGADTEFVELAGHDCIAKMVVADAILLKSSTYFADVTSEMKALIDRCGMVGRANGDLFRRKIGAAVVASGRAGAIHAFDKMNFILMNSHWAVQAAGIGIGPDMGEVADDQEGMK